MAVVNQRIEIAHVGTLPGQHDRVGIASVAVDHIGIDVSGIELSGVENLEVAVGVATLLGAGGVNGSSSVNLLQALGRHGDGHGGGTVRTLTIGHIEVFSGAVLIPGGDFLRAGSVLVEADRNSGIFVIGKTLAQCVHEVVLGQTGSCRGDSEELGNDFVLELVAGGTGGIVGVAVLNQIAAVILAGPFLAFPDNLLESGVASGIFRVQGNAVKPLLPAVGSIGAVDGSYGEAGEEGIGGVHDHLGNLGFNDQIQAEIKTVLGGVTVLVGFRELGSVWAVM